MSLVADMKTIIKIVIPIIFVLAAVVFFMYITANGFSVYNEGLALIYLSEYHLQQELEEYTVRGIPISTITDKDLESVPKLKELIKKALGEEFPKNRTGKILSDKVTLMEYHRYYAAILAEKYSKLPEDFIHILPAHQSDLERYPEAYLYKFDGSYFEYDGIQYGWGNSRFTDYGNDNRADIEVYKVKRPLDPQRHVWSTLTDSDFEKMPILRQAMENIGSVEESIEVQNSMSGTEVDRYRTWYEKNIPSAIFEYDGKYFRLGFWIA